MNPPDVSFFDILKSWQSFVVAGVSALIGAVTAIISRLTYSSRRTGYLSEKVEGLEKRVEGLDGKFEAMARDHVALRIAVAELPRRSEQEAQFDRLINLVNASTSQILKN